MRNGIFWGAIVAGIALAASQLPKSNALEDKPVCGQPGSQNGRVHQVSRTRTSEAFGRTLHYKFEQGNWSDTYHVSSENAKTTEARAQDFCNTGVRPGNPELEALGRTLKQNPIAQLVGKLK